MKKNVLKKIMISVACVSLLVPLFAGCGSKSAPEGSENTGTLTLKGSDTVLPVAQKTSEVFMTDVNKEAVVSVTGGGSGVGIAALIDGTTDIADSSRKIKDEEIAKAKEKGIDPVETKIADDGLSVIVNPQLGIKQLTLAQLKDIYTGKINNWKEVGGPDLKIVTITRDNSSGTYAYFKEAVLQDEDFRADALTEPSNGNIVTVISQTKGAVGYVGLAYLNDKVAALAVSSAEGSPYVVPSEQTVKDKTYPISRPLFMYTNGAPKGLAKEYIDFVLSDKGQAIIEETGFIPVK